MKPVFISNQNRTDAISVQKFASHKFENPWHFHQEIELVLIVRGTGTTFVGDHISSFAPGELILLGNNLPHMMINKPEFDGIGNPVESVAIVLHFKEEFLGTEWLTLSECQEIKSLFKEASKGIRLSSIATLKIAPILEHMITRSPFERIIDLLQVLQIMAQDSERQLLSSINYGINTKESSIQKFNKINSYIMNNFQRSLTLDDVASVANMNRTAFCKYFKDRTQKTLVEFIGEVRVNYAKRLLLEGDRTIAEIGYECGFNNLSNFNRQFKNLTGVSPSSYQKERRLIHRSSY